MRNRLICHVSLAVALMLIFGGKSHAQSYTLSDLGAGSATSINDLGQVVGFDGSQPVEWSGGIETNLDSLGGVSTEPGSINNKGQIVGYSYAGVNSYQAVLWNEGVASALLTSNVNSNATAINNSGTAVGFSFTTNIANSQAILWSGSTPTVLGSAGGTGTFANAINNVGQVVGYSQSVSSSQAVLWNGTVPTLLGSLGGATSDAQGINDFGQVVGSSTYGNGPSVAVLWNGSTPTALGTLGGNTNAHAINNSGVIVGQSYHTGNVNPQAVLWNGTNLVNLNNFLNSSEIAAGWVLVDAADVNNSGTITGFMANSVTGATDAFVLTPVPEPQANAMLLSGICLIGIIARRRKDLN